MSGIETKATPRISVTRISCKNGPTIRSNRPVLESPLKLTVIGCLLLLAAVGMLAVIQRHALVAELEQEAPFFTGSPRSAPTSMMRI